MLWSRLNYATALRPVDNNPAPKLLEFARLEDSRFRRLLLVVPVALPPVVLAVAVPALAT
jgi:hypothetical protein